MALRTIGRGMPCGEMPCAGVALVPPEPPSRECFGEFFALPALLPEQSKAPSGYGERGLPARRRHAGLEDREQGGNALFSLAGAGGGGGNARPCRWARPLRGLVPAGTGLPAAALLPGAARPCADRDDVTAALLPSAMPGAKGRRAAVFSGCMAISAWAPANCGRCARCVPGCLPPAPAKQAAPAKASFPPDRRADPHPLR